MSDGKALLDKYFPEIPKEKHQKLLDLEEALKDWNTKVNLVSRKDTENLFLHHLLSPLVIERIQPFPAGTEVMDVGTGGGIPGLPLAILYPRSSFLLVDSTRKKLDAIKDICSSLSIDNVKTEHTRVEKKQGQFDLVTGKAVTALPRFWSWVKKNIRKGSTGDLTNGVLYWTGGDVEKELTGMQVSFKTYPIHDHIEEAYFSSKKLIHIKLL